MTRPIGLHNSMSCKATIRRCGRASLAESRTCDAQRRGPKENDGEGCHHHTIHKGAICHLPVRWTATEWIESSADTIGIRINLEVPFFLAIVWDCWDCFRCNFRSMKLVYSLLLLIAVYEFDRHGISRRPHRTLICLSVLACDPMLGQALSDRATASRSTPTAPWNKLASLDP